MTEQWSTIEIGMAVLIFVVLCVLAFAAGYRGEPEPPIRRGRITRNGPLIEHRPAPKVPPSGPSGVYTPPRCTCESDYLCPHRHG
jgi:hypothetical protein